MNSSPLVTIGVPVYNGEDYLEECLESIHNQTYENWECFVCNNQSTDNSLAIAEKVAKKDSRIKVITNPEFVDMNTNFNNTFKYITDKTKYYKAVCADDWIFPEFLEQMVDLMEKHPNVGICSSYRLDNTEVNCFGLDYYKRPVFSGKEVLIDQLSGNADVLGSETTVLYRIETLKKTKNYPIIYSSESYHIDTVLAYELISLSDLGFIFQVLSYTRRHETTYTSKYGKRFRTHLNLRETELYKYKSVYPELINRYKFIRAQYGFFLLKVYLRRDKKSIEWHRKWLPAERRFSLTELIQSLIYVYYNRIRTKLRGQK